MLPEVDFLAPREVMKKKFFQKSELHREGIISYPDGMIPRRTQLIRQHTLIDYQEGKK
jgi:hypothetical protein